MSFWSALSVDQTSQQLLFRPPSLFKGIFLIVEVFRVILMSFEILGITVNFPLCQ